jgi:hypothetical protein
VEAPRPAPSVPSARQFSLASPDLPSQGLQGVYLDPSLPWGIVEPLDRTLRALISTVVVRNRGLHAEPSGHDHLLWPQRPPCRGIPGGRSPRRSGAPSAGSVRPKALLYHWCHSAGRENSPTSQSPSRDDNPLQRTVGACPGLCLATLPPQAHIALHTHRALPDHGSCQWMRTQVCPC